MPIPRALLERLAAPVEYGPIRPYIQRVRAGAGLVVFAICSAGVALGTQGAWLPAVAAGVLALHALTRGRTTASPTESMLIDAVCVVGGLALVQHTDQVFIAACAYLIAGSLTFGGARTLVIVLGGYGLAIGVVAVLPLPPAIPPPLTGEPILWLTVAIFLGGVVVSLASASTAVAAARTRQEQALFAERRAAEIKTEFVSMVTHELRTPLTNIAGFAMTMRDTWRDLGPEEAEEFLRIIVGEAEHLANLVDDVLAIPRLEAGRLLVETVDFPLQPAAFRITDLIFPAGGDRSASVAVSGRVRVHADPNRVEQVLRNLLENARKYGGDEIRVDATEHGDEWIVVVADNGPGVPLEHRERIFGAFEQVTGGDARSDKGFGLGLAVARHLVEAMGGRIWYEPGFPVGARFCFTLPRAQDRSAANAAVA
ncbi:MAG: HAMP domain-containing histidine kinase [Acidimicrobiia bacterium]|nr:HAMP domain-containing histidine kinase [Acidimicrobiia bacterium]